MDKFGIVSAGKAEASRNTPVDIIPYLDAAVDELIHTMHSKRGEICALALQRASSLGQSQYGDAAFHKDNTLDTLEELADAAFYQSTDLYRAARNGH